MFSKEYLERFCKVLRRPVQTFDSKWCQKALVLTGLISLSPSKALAKDWRDLEMSDVSADSIQEGGFNAPRTPSSYFPSDNEIIVPYKMESGWSQLMVEDQKGVLREIKGQMQIWQEEQDFKEKWKYDDVNPFRYFWEPRMDRGANANYYDDDPYLEHKLEYLNRKMLRYADKRLMGEVKSAKAGTTLANIGKARKALKPQSKFSFSKDYSVKIRAKALRGLVFFRFKNPYFDDAVLEYKIFRNIAFWNPNNFTNEAKLHLRKNWKELKLSSNFEYQYLTESWFLSWNREISDRFSFIFTSVEDGGNNFQNTNGGGASAMSHQGELRYSFRF